MVQMATPLEFFDSHFHIWDMSPAGTDTIISKHGENYKRFSSSDDPKGTASGHDASILFEPNEKKLYAVAEYEAELEPASSLVNHTGGVFIEAVSVCFTNVPGSSQFFTDACLIESEWASKQLALSQKGYAIVGTAALEAPGVSDTLKNLATNESFRGVRQIINSSPDWPRNGMLGDLLDNADWRKGFSLLKNYGLSFDLQLNPPQFAKAAALIAEHPETTVIINHLGSPTLADLTDTNKRKTFDEGMKALASCSNTYIKISMLCYTDPKWNENPVVVDAVKQIITLFGVDRCCFASNYPPDSKEGWDAKRLITAFTKLVEHLPAEDQQKIFSSNARKAYRM